MVGCQLQFAESMLRKKVDRTNFIWHNINGLKIYPNANSIGWSLGTLFTNFEWARWMGTIGHRALESAFNWDIISQKTEQGYRL